jgi:hypothetical protein
VLVADATIGVSGGLARFFAARLLLWLVLDVPPPGAPDRPA